jgi:hypothetical protein
MEGTAVPAWARCVAGVCGLTANRQSAAENECRRTRRMLTGGMRIATRFIAKSTYRTARQSGCQPASKVAYLSFSSFSIKTNQFSLSLLIRATSVTSVDC